MRKLYCFCLLLSSFDSFSQHRQPIFKTSQDSIQFEKINAQVIELYKAGGLIKTQKLDSLREQQFNLLENRVKGFRYVYEPSKDFTSYSDLKSGKAKPTEITRLSLDGKSDNYAGKELPAEIYLCSRLKELQILNTRIEILPKKLATLPLLKHIEIFNNHPGRKLKLGKNPILTQFILHSSTHLPKSYKKISRLDSLDLSRNNLTLFPDVSKNKKLTKLVLFENSLSTFHSKGSKYLKELNIRNNKYSAIDNSISRYPELKKLTANNNAISHVDEAISQLKNLEQLSFYQNKLPSIPSALYALTNLRDIDLYYNEIERIEPKISNLKNVEILYLSNNKIFSLPESIGELSNLKELYIHHNRISNLPASLSKLTSLKVLRMNNNYFSTIPESILKLSNLENLDLSHNSLHHFPKELASLTKLQLFNAVNNPWENAEDFNWVKQELKSRGAIVND
ncbi:MAG: leucine-rich repeat domain-containing protein [Flammeovirgaceae bacterium]|nr:leucine-rich repeat domain-containing protein [Flammeovirgaceae bacterium]